LNRNRDLNNSNQRFSKLFDQQLEDTTNTELYCKLVSTEANEQITSNEDTPVNVCDWNPPYSELPSIMANGIK